MDMRDKSDQIYHSKLSNQEKIKRLKDLELDCINELEAQDQNMHPEIKHRLSEGLRKACDYIRKLGNNKN